LTAPVLHRSRDLDTLFGVCRHHPQEPNVGLVHRRGRGHLVIDRHLGGGAFWRPGAARQQRGGGEQGDQ